MLGLAKICFEKSSSVCLFHVESLFIEELANARTMRFGIACKYSAYINIYNIMQLLVKRIQDKLIKYLTETTSHETSIVVFTNINFTRVVYKNITCKLIPISYIKIKLYINEIKYFFRTGSLEIETNSATPHRSNCIFNTHFKRHKNSIAEDKFLKTWHKCSNYLVRHFNRFSERKCLSSKSQMTSCVNVVRIERLLYIPLFRWRRHCCSLHLGFTHVYNFPCSNKLQLASFIS